MPSNKDGLFDPESTPENARKLPETSHYFLPVYPSSESTSPAPRHLGTIEQIPDGEIYNTTHVRRNDGDRLVLCDAGNLLPTPGEAVIVQTEQSTTVAIVVTHTERTWATTPPTWRILRKASETDLMSEARIRVQESVAVNIAWDVITKLNVPAKVVRAECPIGSKTIVYLAAEERIDLRVIGRNLAAALRGRVDLRVVGMREASKALGGIGPCGLQLCCNTFLSEFAPVSVKMARDQNLSSQPERISGMCGKLMCCLVYEEAFYRKERAKFPNPGSDVRTSKGEARVRAINVLERTVIVTYRDRTEETLAVDAVQGIEQSSPDNS